MLTIREFNAAHDRHLRRVMWLFLIFLTCLLNAWLWDFDPVMWVHKHIDASIPSWAVRVGCVTIPIAMLLLVGLLLVRWAHCDPRLVCSHCDKGLVRSRFRVVVTHQCPRCHREILIDPDPQHPPSVSHQEAKAVARRNLRRILTFILGFPIVAACGVALGLGAELLKDAGWLNEQLAISIAAGGGLALFAWMIYGLIGVLRQVGKRITCPRCHAKVYPEMAAKWGGCGWCGQRLIAESTEGVENAALS